MSGRVHWRQWLRESIGDPDNPLGESIANRCARECADYIAKIESERDGAEMAIRQLVWRRRRGTTTDPAGFWPMLEEIATRNASAIRGGEGGGLDGGRQSTPSA